MRAKIAIAALALIVALGALAGPAFAKKEKVVFGEFEASITGQTISEATPGVLKVNAKEGKTKINGLEIGPYTFGPVFRTSGENAEKVKHNAGEQDVEHPCKSVKPSGLVTKEKSSELLFKMKFSKCVALAEAGAVQQEVPTSFTLGIKLKSNFSAEVGKSESSLEIEEGTVSFKGALKKCPVLIPAQTIPAKENPEKEYEEIVEYENESFEPSGIEHSKKLKELYPSGEKETLNVLFLEKFHHIHAYMSQEGPCTNAKGVENGKIVTEGPYKGMLEFTAGHLFGEIEDLEVKNGNLKFKEKP